MKTEFILATLAVSSIVAGFTVFSKTARRLILGWLIIGILQSLFLLIVGFELLALLNLFFVAATATVLHLFSALFGTGAYYAVESIRFRRDWIYGIGAGLTLAGIIVFALAGHSELIGNSTDLQAPVFARELISRFPELPWILGVVFFLGIVIWASIGRAGWRPAAESEHS
jgi:hypothetical protein